MKKEKTNIQKKSKKAAIISTIICLAAMSMNNVFAAAPSGVDTSSYNGLVEIIFWVAGIAVAGAGGIPSIIKITQGQADEDPRGRNAGIAGLVITGACVGALFAVKALLF